MESVHKKKILRLKKPIKIFVFIFLFLLGFFFIKNIGNYFYKNHSKEISVSSVEDIIGILETIPATGDSLVDQLYVLSKKDRRIKQIIEKKEEYPQILLEMLSRNIDMVEYVLSYNEKKGEVLSDNIGDVKKGEYPLLFQYDTRWGYGLYGNDTIAINGCGPASVSMVVAGLTGRNDITPYTVSEFAYQNGYYQDGTSWSLFTEGIKQFGVSGKTIPLVKTKMIRELEQGHPIICSMRPGDFTTTGHLIVLVGVENGEFIVHDSNSKERSSKLWSYEKIANQIKNLWSFQEL